MTEPFDVSIRKGPRLGFANGPLPASPQPPRPSDPIKKNRDALLEHREQRTKYGKQLPPNGQNPLRDGRGHDECFHHGFAVAPDFHGVGAVGLSGHVEIQRLAGVAFAQRRPAERFAPLVFERDGERFRGNFMDVHPEIRRTGHAEVRVER